MRHLLPRLVVGDIVHTQLSHADYSVVIETADPTGAAYANPIGRFKDLRVGFCVELSAEPEGAEGDDGGCSPALELFEPLTTDGQHYHLPWFIPEGLSLVDTGEWGGWSAWLRQDNLQILDNRLTFLGADASHVNLRWSGRLSEGGAPFLFERALRIGPVRLHARPWLDVQATVARVFGDSQARRLLISREPWAEGRTDGEAATYALALAPGSASG